MDEHKAPTMDETMQKKQRHREEVLGKVTSSSTRIYDAINQEYNIDGCSCMSCGCFKSAWTIVLSPAGVAAGMAAFAADSVL